MKRTNDLGNDSIPRLVLRLAIPAMVAQLVNVLYGIVDRMYIGNIPDIGETALAGAGICGPIVTLLSSFGTLVGLGGAPLLTIRMGEKNLKGARQILANCFLLLLVLAGVLTGLFLLIKRPLLLWFGASAATLPYADTYLTIYTAGTFFALLAAGLNYFIICQGYSTTGMATVLLGAVLNILLDPLFIFTLRMGVAGAALATVLSQVASCAFVLLFLFHRNTPVRITFGGYSARIIRRVLALRPLPFHHPGHRQPAAHRAQRGAAAVRRAGRGRPADHRGDYCAELHDDHHHAHGGDHGRDAAHPQLQLRRPADGADPAGNPLDSAAVPGFHRGDVRGFPAGATGVRADIHRRSGAYRPIQLGDPDIHPGDYTAGVPVHLCGRDDGAGITRVSVSLSLFRKISYMAGTLAFAALWGARAAFYAEPAADLLGAAVSTLVFSRLFGRLMRRRDAMPEGQALYT